MPPAEDEGSCSTRKIGRERHTSKFQEDGPCYLKYKPSLQEGRKPLCEHPAVLSAEGLIPESLAWVAPSDSLLVLGRSFQERRQAWGRGTNAGHRQGLRETRAALGNLQTFRKSLVNGAQKSQYFYPYHSKAPRLNLYVTWVSEVKTFKSGSGLILPSI